MIDETMKSFLLKIYKSKLDENFPDDLSDEKYVDIINLCKFESNGGNDNNLRFFNQVYDGFFIRLLCDIIHHVTLTISLDSFAICVCLKNRKNCLARYHKCLCNMDSFKCMIPLHILHY